MSTSSSAATNSTSDAQEIWYIKQAAARAAEKAAAARQQQEQQDQAAANKAVHTYAQTPPSSASGASSKRAAETASFALMMDYYMDQQGVSYSPGSSGYQADEAALLEDPKALADVEQQFAQGESGSGLSAAGLQGLAHSGEVAAGESQLPASQQTGQAIEAYDAAGNGGQAPASVTTALQQAGFDEEVMVYERGNGLGLATPGSAQWNKDAQSFLASSQRISVRDTVIATYAGQLSAQGLDQPNFDAQLWAGETVAQAKQGNTAQAVATIANAFSDPNAAGSDDGLDPNLARQALAADTYVTDLPGLIARTMRGSSPSDGVKLLSQVVSSASADPQLATEIVAASATTLQADLKAQSSAGKDQAAQAFVSTAAIYYVLQQAAQSGAPGASQLVNEVAQWSFDAANATDAANPTDSTGGRFGTPGVGPSELDNMLADVLTTAYQQKAAPNLFYAWTKLAPQGQTGGDHDNTTSWGNFQATLGGNPPQGGPAYYSSALVPFQQALPKGTKLASKTVTAAAPGASASVPTVQALTQSIQDKINAGETLPEAINAVRAQMGAEDRNGTGAAAEQTLAEAALTVAGQNNLAAYYKNPTAANDPIAVASSQLAALNVFDPAVLAAATQLMTGTTNTPNLPALQNDAGQAGAAYQQWQADLAASEPAAVTANDEQAYLDALTAELNDASGETGQAWLNDPTQVDRQWKAEYLVSMVNLAPQIRSGDQQALNTADTQLQTSFETLSILAAVNAAGGPDKQAQALTADLSGLSTTDPLYNEVMQSGDVQALQAQAQAAILAAAQPSHVQASQTQLMPGTALPGLPSNGMGVVPTAPASTPESQLANEAKVLAEYQGTVLYGGSNGLLNTTINAPVTQQLFGAVADGALPHGASPGNVLDNVANVLNGLQANPDLAGALYQQKFAGGVSSAIDQYSSQDDPQKYYTDLGEIYVDVGGGYSAQGTDLRKAVEARLGGADPVETHPQQPTGRAEALDPQTALPSYELDAVKSSGTSMQLYQDILDDAPNTSWGGEIASETGYKASGAAPKPINAPNTDPVGLAGVNGLTPVTTRDDLINQLGSDEGLTPTHLPQNAADQAALSQGDFAEYNLNQTVYGGTTLGGMLKSVMSAAGVADVSAQDPLVLADLPLNFQSQDGRSQSLGLLEVDGRAGQSAYVGPADVTARSSFGNWIGYNGFAKGTLFAQPNLITNGQSVPLQDNAYWVTNQTGITTWDKVKTDAEIGVTIAAGLLATFVQPEAAPLWLALLADAADVYMTASAAYGAAQAVGSLTTDDGYKHWQNWLDLGANTFGALAAGGSIATRSATIIGRLGVTSEDFAAAANLTKAGEDASAAAKGAEGAGKPPTPLTPYRRTLPSFLNSPDMAGAVRGINTAQKTLGYKAVGYLAAGTNIGSLGNQGYQMFVEHQGETGQNVLQFVDSAGLMGAGFFVSHGGADAPPEDNTPGEADNVARSGRTGKNAPAAVPNTAAGVDAAMRVAHPDYISGGTPSAAPLVTSFDDKAFENTVVDIYRARRQKLPAGITQIPAVVVRDPATDEVTNIFVRQSLASDPTVLAHELYHSYASRGFRTAAQSLLVKLKGRNSNLSEGAVDYLIEELDLSGYSQHTARTEEASAVRDIVGGIGKDVFYKAFFEGDKDALLAFVNKAAGHPRVKRPIRVTARVAEAVARRWPKADAFYTNKRGASYRQPGPPNSLEAMVSPAPTPAVSPAVAAGDRVYPVDLWPVGDAMIFQGDFQGHSTVHLYAVPVDPGQRGQALSFGGGDVAAHASVTPDDLDVKWVDTRSDAPVGQYGKTVNQRFSSLTASLPDGKVWAVVASNATIDDVKANGLTNVQWLLNQEEIPGQSGTAYQPPGYGTHADGRYGGPVSDKFHLGLRSHGLGQAVLSLDKGFRRARGYVFRDSEGWVKAGTQPTDGRYIPQSVVASVGTPIPVVDPASGRIIWLDGHNHIGNFNHPVYIKPEPYLDRISFAKNTPGIADVSPANKDDPLPGIIITLQHIPYLVQRGGRWGPYTDQDVGSTTQVYAHHDDWKLLRQVELLDPAQQNAVIPSITGLQAWREKGYGSDITTRDYMEHLLLYFHPTDLSAGAENRTAYPISGENTIYAKEVWSLLNGRGRQTRSTLVPDAFGEQVATDLPTILQTYEVLRDAGIVTVTHKDSSFAQFLADGRPIGAPGDDRYFFKEMMLDMALGPYNVSGLPFGDRDFVLSDGEINRIVQQGGVKRPLAEVVAHFQLGNFTRAGAQHFDLVMAALNHPLMPHLRYDSSWLPSIDAQMQEMRNGQPLWMRSSPGARPTFNGAYLDAIRTGKVGYGGDVVNPQTYQQQFAPWYAQQPPLRAIAGDVVPGTGDSLLAHYGGAMFMKLYQDSKPAIDWFRYRAYKGISYDKVSGSVSYDNRNDAYIAGWKDEGRRASLAAWAQSYEGAHPEVTNPDRVREYLAKDQVPGQPAPSDVYPGTSFTRGPTTLNNPDVGKQARETFKIAPNAKFAWGRVRLENFRFPDGKPLHPEAVKVGTEAANIGFPVQLQLATVAATHAVATAQDEVKAEMKETGDRSDRRNRIGISAALGTLGAAAASGPFWIPAGTDATTTTLGIAFGSAAGAAVMIRGTVNVFSSLSKTVNRKTGSELPTEEAAMDPQAADFIRRRFVNAASGLGLDPGRVTGEGSVDEAYREFLSKITYLLKTPLDVGNGETNDVRHQIMAWVQGYISAEAGRALGTEQASLEPTNLRTRSGQAFAGIASIAYTLGAAKALSSIVADPALVYDYFLAAGTGISAAFQAVGAISGANRTAWQELRFWTRLQSVFGNAVSGAGIGGLVFVQATDAVSHGSEAAGTEAVFAGVAAISLLLLARAGLRSEVPKIPPQEFDPPSDKYPWTPKGIWNRMLPGEPGQQGVGAPRQIAKLTIYAGLGLTAVGITTILEALRQQGPTAPPATVISPGGTPAYSNPSATGSAAGVFQKYASVQLTGEVEMDDKGKIWVQVTGVAVGGRVLTAWVDVSDIGYISVSEPAGTDLRSGASTSFPSLASLAADAPVIPTGHIQKDASGNFWLQVTANENGASLTGWIEVNKISSGSSPSATYSPPPTQSPIPSVTRSPGFVR